MSVTIKDVAKYANVSAMTVTRAIKSPALVNAETLKKVQNAIKELEYIPNYTASALRSARTNTVGVTVFDVENPFIGKLLMELETKLRKYNYSMLVSFAYLENIDDYDIYTKLKMFNVDLAIYIPIAVNEKIRQLSPSDASRCLQLFKNVYGNEDSFMIDDIYGAYLATKHLLENGHRKILLIDYDQRIPLNRDVGYKRALEEAGVAPDDRYVLQLSEFTTTAEAADKIQDTLTQLQPTAVIAVTQQLSTACLFAMGNLKLKVYDDVSLIIYDDTTISQYLDITTVAHPFDEISEDIANWAIRKIQNNFEVEEPQHTVIKPYLKIRNSVKKIL